MTPLKFTYIINLAIIILPYSVFANPKTPQFTNFPANKITTKRLEHINFSSNPNARMLRTRLKRRIGEKASFGGHYVAAQIGCGSGCMTLYLIDIFSGRIYNPEFKEGTMIRFEKNSLLIASVIDDYDRKRTLIDEKYFRWDDKQKKLIPIAGKFKANVKKWRAY